MMKQSIRRYLLLAAVCGLTGALVSGCTSTQSGSLNNGAQAPSSSGSLSSQSSGAEAGQSQGTAGEITLPSADDDQSSASAEDSQGSGTSYDQASSAQDNSGESQPDIVTYDEQNQNGSDPQSTVPADNTDESLDEFTGSFSKADNSESVVLSLDNDTVLTFGFSVCGINGTAKAAGNTDVYNGDDGYTITFAVAGDTLTVTVGGDDAASSPINGTYIRNPDTEAEYTDEYTDGEDS